MSPPVEVQYHLVDKLVSQFYLSSLLNCLDCFDCWDSSTVHPSVGRIEMSPNDSTRQQIQPSKGAWAPLRDSPWSSECNPWWLTVVKAAKTIVFRAIKPNQSMNTTLDPNDILWYCRGFCQESTLIESARIETKHDQTLASTCSNVLRRVVQSCKPIRRKRDHCRSQHHFLNVLIQLNSLYIPRWIN